MSSWTDELKKEVIEEYTSQEPTPETTIDIVAEIATKHNLTVNGVRMVLSKAEVYVAKGKAVSANTDVDKPKRKTKQESLDDLTNILTEHGVTVDDTVISKLTGKAADFFTGAFKHFIEN